MNFLYGKNLIHRGLALFLAIAILSAAILFSGHFHFSEHEDTPSSIASHCCEFSPGQRIIMQETEPCLLCLLKFLFANNNFPALIHIPVNDQPPMEASAILFPDYSPPVSLTCLIRGPPSSF